MGIKKAVKDFCIKRENQKYKRELESKKFSYLEWVKQDEEKKKVSCKDTVDEFVIFKLAKGKLSKEAIPQLANYFKNHPQVQILYGDEDVMEKNGHRHSPWIKPCWSPDTYETYFYVGSVVAIRKELLIKCGVNCSEWVIEYMDTCEIREQMDRIFMEAEAFQKGSKVVERVPYVLFHAFDAKEWNTHFSSRSVIHEEEYMSGISVIIPSKDNPALLKQCLDSLKKQNVKLDIIVVDNGSEEGNRKEIETYTEGMKYIYEPMEFNFSRMCNIGARHAEMPILLFLNDDIELGEANTLQTMYQKAVKPYVGAVGLKLYYPGGKLIQHAGVINTPMGPDHKLRTLPDTEDYYFGWNTSTHNSSAVTGACLMVEKDKFWEVDGFLEELSVCYNDVDLCFRLYEDGYHNVVINEIFAWHHESVSRGNDEENPQKKARFQREWTRLYELHPAFIEEDPYYPIEMDRWSLNNRIQPAYIYGIYELQQPQWRAYIPLKSLRHDACLMARVERNDKEKIQGFGIVLGDDNACYKRYLVLSPEMAGEEIAAGSFIMQLDGKYRYELEENVPDQKNVALSGYCISRDKEGIPTGRYKVGMIAVNKVTGLKLFSWCGKVLDI